jgi:D-alanine-D-alanine ligase
VEFGSIHFFTNSENDEYDMLLLANIDNDAKLAKHQYYSETEQKLYGSGIWENKGGLIVMLAALQALRFTKILKKLKVGILICTDETLQGRIAKPIIQRISQRAKYVIGLHGAFLNGGLVTSRSGAAVYRCEMNLQKTDDASLVALACSQFNTLIKNWTDLSDPVNGLVIAPHEIKLNSNITEPFAHGSVILSVRFNDFIQMKEVDTKIRKMISKRTKSKIIYQFEGGVRRSSMLKTNQVETLWLKIKTMAKKLDINLREEHRWSSADICHVDENKYMIDGLGPVGAKPVSGQEFILRHSILERASLLAAILTELES